MTQSELPKHLMCRCRCYIQPRTEWLSASQLKFWEEGCKLAARLMLSQYNRNRLLAIPTDEEWFGLNLLERDGEL